MQKNVKNVKAAHNLHAHVKDASLYVC